MVCRSGLEWKFSIDNKPYIIIDCADYEKHSNTTLEIVLLLTIKLSWLAVTGPTTHSPALADHAPEEIEGQEDGDDDEEED